MTVMSRYLLQRLEVAAFEVFVPSGKQGGLIDRDPEAHCGKVRRGRSLYMSPTHNTFRTANQQLSTYLRGRYQQFVFLLKVICPAPRYIFDIR